MVWKLINRGNPALGYTAKEFACAGAPNCNSSQFFLLALMDANRFAKVGLGLDLSTYQYFALRVTSNPPRLPIACPVTACARLSHAQVSEIYPQTAGVDVIPRMQKAARLAPTKCLATLARAYAALLSAFETVSGKKANDLDRASDSGMPILSGLTAENKYDIVKQASAILNVAVDEAALALAQDSPSDNILQDLSHPVIPAPARCCIKATAAVPTLSTHLPPP